MRRPPASTFARSSRSLISVSRRWPLRWIVCSASSAAGPSSGAGLCAPRPRSSSTSAKPRIAVSGVRSSWLTFARNIALVWLARSAWPRAASSQRFAEANVSTASLRACSCTIARMVMRIATLALLMVEPNAASSGGMWSGIATPRLPATQKATFAASPASSQNSAERAPATAWTTIGISTSQAATGEPGPPFRYVIATHNVVLKVASALTASEIDAVQRYTSGRHAHSSPPRATSGITCWAISGGHTCDIGQISMPSTSAGATEQPSKVRVRRRASASSRSCGGVSQSTSASRCRRIFVPSVSRGSGALSAGVSGSWLVAARLRATNSTSATRSIGLLA